MCKLHDHHFLLLHASGTEIEFGNEQLSITQSDNTACRTVTAYDNDISDGTRNFMIEVRSDGIATTTVPVQFNPMSVTVSVIDNDGKNFTARPAYMMH